MSTVVDPKTTKPPVEEDPFRYGWRYVQIKGLDGQVTLQQIPLTLEDVLHPQDDDFIVNTAAHNEICRYLQTVFKARLQDQSGAVVTHDTRVDWEVPGTLPNGPDVAVFLHVRPDWDPRAGTLHL